ncbi:YXWGXW repeat-containing protein [Chitinophaga sp. 30R24]|uniref:YXWGXW repeat-containing protein n=1 Tax=Chitinophaga sp. 30R24 TaxID=3248838 RepID=UPI003B8FA563
MKKTLITLALFASALATRSAQAQVSVGVSINIAPPVLPVYTQPVCPVEGYIWTPGYWAYGPAGYYWIPGVWVSPPRPGLLWTPGYWGFTGGVYSWHAGYWGPHVGFYGGINYGFGYSGVGFSSGIWEGNVYRYNTAVTNVNTTIVHNTYINNTVVNNTTIVNNNRTSFNGTGGITARPIRTEEVADREQHVPATTEQVSHERNIRPERSQFIANSDGQVVRRSENGAGNRPERIADNSAGNRINRAETSAPANGGRQNNESMAVHQQHFPQQHAGSHTGRGRHHR